MSKQFHSICMAGLVCLYCLPAASAAVIFVKHDAAGANNGTSWANAYTALQPAINAAVAGDEIWVAAGTYIPTVAHFAPAPRGRTFYIDSKNIQLYGGFNGSETLRSQRNIAANTTILSGELGAAGNADNALHVVWIDNVNTTMRVDGFTITGGNANIFSFPSNVGGGIFNDRFHGAANSPTIANCIFHTNSAFEGGAIFNFGFFGTSSPIITDCSFTSNFASQTGGAICNRVQNGASHPTIIGCTFNSNHSSEKGGAVFSVAVDGASNPNLTNCNFSSNTSSQHGGAMFNWGSTNGTSNAVLTNCNFTGNSAGLSGGAIFNYARDEADLTGFSSASLTNCHFTSNSATDGGAMYNDSDFGTSSSTHNRCSFIGNSVSANGGAVFNYGGRGTNLPTYTNCSFSGNRAVHSGAFYNYQSIGTCRPEYLNCTFSGNQSVNSVGAILHTGATSTINNCIIWGNKLPQLTGSFSLGNSIVQGGFAGGVNILNADPLFVSQPNFNLAPTTAGDLHLQACSPAIDAGILAGTPPHDLDGNPRPHDGDNDGFPDTDMGAYEFQGNRAPVAVCQNQNVTLTGSSATLAASVLNGGSTGCSPLGYTVGGMSMLTFDCKGDAGKHFFTLTVTDVFGGTKTCTATITVGPDADCDGFGDFCDQCPGGDDGVDNNFDGLPDCKFYPGFDNLIDDWVCGNNNSKFLVCHNGDTKCLGQGAFAEHLAHGDYLGPCNAASCANPLIRLEKGQRLAFQNIYPNPAMYSVNLEFASKLDQLAVLEFYDVLGRLVHRQTVQLRGGTTEVEVHVFDWKSGTYNVIARGEESALPAYGRLMKVWEE